MRRVLALLTVLAIVVAACGDDSPLGGGEAGPETTASDAPTETTTLPDDPDSEADPTTPEDGTETTGVQEPEDGPAFIKLGETGPYVLALQTYLRCAGYGPIEVDGVFGDGTAGVVETVQDALDLDVTGEPSEDLFSALSRACAEEREILVGESGSVRLAGNVAPGDSETFRKRLVGGQELTVRVDHAVLVTIVIGEETASRVSGPGEMAVRISTDGLYYIVVESDSPTSYQMTVTAPPPPPPPAEGFLLAAEGFNEIDFGMEAGEAEEYLVGRFGPPAADTGWLDIDPQEEYECASVERTLTWTFEGDEDFAATTLDVSFHDLGYSNPAFARWDYRLTDHEDRDLRGPGMFLTPQGLSVGQSYVYAVLLGFVLGGYEELSHGSLDGINVHVYNPTDGYDPADYEAEGWVGSMWAGSFVCPDPF